MSHRPLTALLAAIGVLCALPAVASARGFSLGVTAADVDASSALLWTRSDKQGSGIVQVAANRRFGGTVLSEKVKFAGATDLTATLKLIGLKPGKTYYYRFTMGRDRSEVGRFETAPAPRTDATVRFAYSGDADPVKIPGMGKLFFAPFAVYARMASEGNDFNVNMGDTMYSDTDSQYERQDPIALTLAAKRGKYRDVLIDPGLRRVRAQSGIYNHWDDHEFLNDFAKDQTDYPTLQGVSEPSQEKRIQKVDGRKLYADGARAFLEYMPATYTQRDGIYRTFRWGRNVELFFLDERSFRSAGADEGPECRNPQGATTRDFAPTAPQERRDVFASLIPSLATPVPQACLDTINDPKRTFLGSRQYAAFTKAVKASTARWKIVMNEMPVQQLYLDPYDRWEGYAAERIRLIEYLRKSVRNVVFLTTDVHANLVGDVRLKTLEPGGPTDSGIMEYTTGPVGTVTFADDVNGEVGRPDAATLARDFFLTQPPPQGTGTQCASLDVFSYGQVTVTAKSFTVALKDGEGKPVRDKAGKACGPYRLRIK